MMYSSIFADIHIDDRRMKKRQAEITVAVQEPVRDKYGAPSERDILQMAEGEIQMAAYLASLGGQAQEQQRPLPERDRPEVREPRDRDVRRDDYFLRQYHGGDW